MHSIKYEISEWLNLEKGSLNEIEIEDVQFTEFAQQNINSVVNQMLCISNPNNQITHLVMPKIDGIPCKGFWVAKSKDLVVYLRIGDQSKAIVVPQEGWTIRNDITIN